MTIRRLVSIIAVATVLSAGFTNTAQAGRRPQEKLFRTSDGNGYSDRDVRQLIRQAAHRWHVSGGVRKALCIASRESGFNEHDRNSSSGAAGVYQFLPGTWNSVKQHYRALRHRLHLAPSVFNARANVVLAIRYAHAGGWGPWSTSGAC